MVAKNRFNPRARKEPQAGLRVMKVRNGMRKRIAFKTRSGHAHMPVGKGSWAIFKPPLFVGKKKRKYGK